MGIYSQIMFLYGVTFLISMFVALIIWIFAKLIDLLPEESLTLKEVLHLIFAGKMDKQNPVNQKPESKPLN